MRLLWARQTERDIARIAEHIAVDDPAMAVRIVEEIERAADRLLAFPKIGEPFVADLRKLSVGRGLPYVLVYGLTHSTIEILRVHHAAQDWRPR